MGFNYIVLEVKSIELPDAPPTELPIIYPDRLVHADVAKAIMGCESLKGFDVKPISAGSVLIHCDATHGSSTTLDLKSGITDTALINNFPYFHGISWDKA